MRRVTIAALFLLAALALAGCNNIQIIPSDLESQIVKATLVAGYTPTPTPTLTPVPPTNTPTVTPTPHVTILTTANIRLGPSTETIILGVAPAGGSYTIIEKNADATWWRILYRNLRGWVFGELVEVSGGDAVGVSD